MAGIELIISSICNATFCNAVYDNPITDSQLTRKQMVYNDLAKQINGKNLKIATYNNYPLSWVERSANGTLYGYGIAFDIVEILKKNLISHMTRNHCSALQIAA
ncbi:uncharacterized protein LOC119192882, partial [Manduca sexta]|uniref:uncharacterized protein LOC119192882 n=1 Tax=Manduca sexta TaxID=7130 RepID=UPI00188E021A